MSQRDRGVLAERTARAERLARVREPHVQPLNALVRRWRSTGLVVPWFDPADGGVDARVLVLMEAPGPRTIRYGDDGFCSEDNDDPTARTFAALRREAGLCRRRYVRWNAVPYAVHDDDGGWRAPRAADHRAAVPMLRAVLDLLPGLEVVVVLGASAVRVHAAVTSTQPVTRALPLLAAPHPSPRNAGQLVDAIQRLRAVLGFAAIVAPCGCGGC